MKVSVAFAALVLLSTTAARADDPMPVEQPTISTPPTAIDDPGASFEPAPEPAPPAPAKRARLSNPTPHAIRHVRKDDGDSRLEKKEDTVLGGTHWRIKTPQGAVHVWIPPDYDRETAGTVIYVLETDKVESDIESPASGRLRHIGEAGETYDVGTQIGAIE